MHRCLLAQPSRKATRCVIAAAVLQSFLNPLYITGMIAVERRHSQISFWFLWLFLIARNQIRVIKRDDCCFLLLFQFVFLMAHHTGSILFLGKINELGKAEIQIAVTIYTQACLRTSLFCFLLYQLSLWWVKYRAQPEAIST